MNKDLIPLSLHHLIPLVEVWGIGDDGYRCDKVEKATTADLITLVSVIRDSDVDDLNQWFIDPLQLKLLTKEYLDFSAFFMAYEYAEAVLKDRNERAKSEN